MMTNQENDRGECRSSYCECLPGQCAGGRVDKREDEAARIRAAGMSATDIRLMQLHDEIKAFLIKRDQGRVMGAVRRIMLERT
jgi:hypothetical protein